MFGKSIKAGTKLVLSRNISCTSRWKCSATQTNNKKTALFDLHKDLGAKMVPFCGWDMPLMYPTGVLKEHFQCRNNSALFDVSHMGQLRIHGKDRVEFFESIVVADIQALPVGHSKLSVFTTEQGGIIDDTMITNAGENLYVVVNAGCADKDIAHIKQKMAEFKATGKDVSLELMEDQALIAVQGPSTESIVSKLAKLDLSNMEFMTQRHAKIDNIDVIITRCGYTGEDGFEISVSNSNAVRLAKILLDTGVEGVKCAGLGARDSLRLEAGLCLYGHDLNEEITPIEATLGWLISKRRKEAGGFPGAAVIQKQLKEGVSKKRVGLIVEGPPARENTVLVDEAGKQIGHVTSGTLSPMTKQSISMCYLNTEHSKNGTKVFASIRGRQIPAVVSKMPFVPTNYKKITPTA
ncbi:aminomethyltransferase [Heterostelium album PN500]|uniref:Aminomethyltransferase n=1 Tax=Heterostelium pallidum (strain ATCC 26659 / Pp 5 / PN500) TaxID=670386 RepID=D3B0J0_HETP5|nr:aminomethyltransferase [Heterostelium album PN500]EFA84814.1 aminomethyltransferase [Heterostelium album PN500]|eukprot:XP_020436925.1 aminomethyltransferase [Heterostelium album PN500]